jgi:hypothetical protein
LNALKEGAYKVRNFELASTHHPAARATVDGVLWPFKQLAKGVCMFGGDTTLTITSKLGGDINTAFLPYNLLRGYDDLVFPEEEKVNGKRDVGRSKDGRLRRISLIAASQLIEAPLDDQERYVCCVNDSCERVIEDEVYPLLASMAQSPNFLVRHMTYGLDWVHAWLYTLPLQRKGRMHIEFGNPIPIAELRGMKRIERTEFLRQEVGKLSVLYPTQMAAMAVSLAKEGNMASETTVGMQAVRDNIKYLQDTLPEHNLRFLPQDIDEIVAQAHRQFWQCGVRRIAHFDGTHVDIHNREVFQQYANHCKHLLEGIAD